MAGSALGLELEGLSNEDREFEAAKQFVRFAADTVKNAVAQPQSNPVAAAAAAIQQAAQVHAPGLLVGRLARCDQRPLDASGRQTSSLSESKTE